MHPESKCGITKSNPDTNSNISLKLFKNMYTNYLKGIIDTPSLDLADQSDRLKIIKNAFETQASLKKTKEHFLYINI